MSETEKPTVRTDFRTLADGRRAALLTIDNPPVNAGSLRMRTDLLEAIGTVCREDGLAGVVLTGANGNFVAGADIREFDAPPQPPHLPEVIAAIESCPVPVVAAIDGAALGGGYELALGCDARIATARSLVGLPEVTLGLIPGSGGTVRLPRLVPLATAMSLVASGRLVRAGEAKDLGMIDRVVDGNPIEAALTELERRNSRKNVLRERPVIASSPNEIAAAEAEARKTARGADAVGEAAAAVKAAASLPAEESMERERATSLRLRVGDQSKALRHLFLAERVAGKAPEGVAARRVTTIGVVGAGRMGHGIALAFASRGLDVRLAEENTDMLAVALDDIRKTADDLVRKSRLAAAEDLTSRIVACDLAAMADCDLVVEAITEDMAAKTALFAELDRIVRPDAILASNTSYLDIDAIAAATRCPARVAGLHFFNPANVMRLVEVIRAEATSDEVHATLMALCKRLGKVAVPARVGEGFIGNRIFSAYRKQCEFLLEEGAFPEDVDRAMRDFGMAMGPFAVFDLAGLDIAWATRKRLAPTRDPNERYVVIADRLCEAGRFGRKTGKGWYDYDNDPRGAPDPVVRTIIEEASAEKGITRRLVSDEEIRARLLAAIVNEASFVLADGIAERPGDIDLVLVHGYGFPKLKGGPLHHAAGRPRATVLAEIRTMVSASGPGTEEAPNIEDVLSAD